MFGHGLIWFVGFKWFMKIMIVTKDKGKKNGKPFDKKIVLWKKPHLSMEVQFAFPAKFRKVYVMPCQHNNMGGSHTINSITWKQSIT